MSAYMVADQTINRVVTWLASDVDINWWLQGKVEEALQIDTKTLEWRLKIGNAVFQLNIDAVNARYGQGEAAHFRPLDYQYRIVIAPKLQVYKSLRCWLYQCCEGDVFKRPLYQEPVPKIF
jgi:hypothetical protein